ncbi:hypothetical protein A1A1_15878 [Planococcus antarcticus DSM 14505]|uniref:NAD-dependent epimerase n=1 Tax=Planococcus antarcticus DSM 14505 TaxID=1185653 RepID=A0A1C7DDK6_9BACL|nr:SDR family oxidoreductase [Planococcus antarcticus]ANU09534.1 NAD-dependent epimerase [Planococcus antarcticus DSM 14505]EIM05499.1 hypothetical protein A1A1_15878 [Planococcus antarcticus DSM 14505]
MKIIIFGASGRTGKPLVMQALERGHEVTAFVRSKAKLPIQHENLTIFEGDVLIYEDVELAVRGQAAVLSVLGHTKNSPKNLLTRAMENITKAMDLCGIKRLINLTGAGVKVEKDVKQGLVSRLFGLGLKVVAKELWIDSVNHKECIIKADLDWTIVRAPRLVDGEKTEQYRTGYFKFKKPFVRRSDVAHFMLEELTKNEYVKKYPLIGAV